MIRRVLVIAISAALFISSTSMAQGAVKTGDTCSKVGKTSTAAGKKYTCIKVKGKPVWNKGVVVKNPVVKVIATPTATPTATPKPSASPSASPSTTASATPSQSPAPTASSTPSPTSAPSATPTPSPTVSSSSLGCASAGGSCVVGDTGPGGGVVFYVQPGTIFGSWKYLEVAPPTWNGENEAVLPLCSATLTSLTTSVLTGKGLTNTLAVIAQCGTANAGSSEAAKVAYNYRGGGKSDWYLPSKDELSLLFDKRNVMAKIASGAPYWSSSQDSLVKSWTMDLGTGVVSSEGNGIDRFVRPIRAFG
ncbi:MAG: hypothetical protein NTY21_05230 [Actinobacteria bacterium]|nr:hypothetical protein [Actinomycetota bacterium]